LNNSSSMGFIMKLILSQKEFEQLSQYKVFLSIDRSGIQINKGYLYHSFGKKIVPLVLDDLMINTFNNVLEDLFRIAFTHFIAGYITEDRNIKDAISAFMLKYELDEHGYELESIRRMYDRNRINPMKRLQFKQSNRVIGY